MSEIYTTVFGGRIQVNQVAGSPGTLFPTGTNKKPSNNFTDALQLAVNYGINEFEVSGTTSLETVDVTGYTFSSPNPVTSILQIWPSANVHNCQFKELTIVDSTLDGNNLLRECAVSNLTYVEGLLYNCTLSGTIQIAGATNTYLLDCKSGCVGLGGPDLPKIDMAAGEVHVAIRNWSGPIKFINNTNALSTLCVDISSGATIIIDSSCTAGTLYIRGIGNITDQLGNRYVNGPGKMVLHHEAHIDVQDISDEIAMRAVDGTITQEQALRIVLASLAGKRDGLGTGTEQYFAQDGVKPRITFTPDAAGNGVPVLDGTP